MPGGLHASVFTLQAAGVPCASKVTANFRVNVASGPVSLVSDVLSFPGPPTVGNWIVGNQRVLVSGVPTVGQSGAGQAIIPGASPVPVVVNQADTRASGM